jgi:hypothetical protein
MEPEAEGLDDLSKEAQNEENEIQVEEILHGRILKPTGNIYKIAPKELSAMSRPELLQHIQMFEALVSDAQVALDYRRTRLSMATNELEYREAEEQRKLRAYKAPYNVGGKVKIPVSIDTKRRHSNDSRSAFFGQIEKWRSEGKPDSEIAQLLADMMRGSR